MTVVTGLDRIATDAGHIVRGRQVALLAHPASVDASLRPAHIVLHEAGASVAVLLGPEHGLGGEAQDMEGVAERSRQSGPRVFSLYGETEASLRPTAEMLADVDLLVVDLQDVGARYYTFVWSAAMCLEVCAEIGLPMVVLDRPNPLGGLDVEGPGIDARYRSFVGHHDVATRHGLTIAEVLMLYAHDLGLRSSLEVVEMRGYRRDQWFEETGLPWVLPSPNMPTPETALVYPGMCLIEGTNVSEGRGTTRPFELVGAPWVDGDALVDALETAELPGCAFRAVRFKPMFHKHGGTTCGGVQTHVTDRRAFRPLLTGVAMVQALFQLGQSGRFLWRTEAYEFVEDRPAIDLLAGGPWLREGIEAGRSIEALRSSWASQEDAFRHRRENILLYKV